MTYLRVSSSKLVAHAHQHNSESVRGGQVAEEMDSPRKHSKRRKAVRKVFFLNAVNYKHLRGLGVLKTKRRNSSTQHIIPQRPTFPELIPRLKKKYGNNQETKDLYILVLILI